MEAAVERLGRDPGVRRLATWLNEVAGSRLFAYGSVLLIQAKVLWRIWEFRDFSAGDTSNYFVYADSWTNHLQVEPLFSPLYTAFWGSLRWFISDAYAVTLTHRILIVFAVTILVLAVLRRLFSPGIAWAMGVWWALLPTNFDTLNEVHLFALIPILVATLVALTYTGTRMRAAVFGILLGSAVVVRNEIVVAALGWLLICIVYEWRARRRERSRNGRARPLPTVLGPYGVAILAVVALALPTIWRARDPQSIPQWVESAQKKQDLALCQHYAVGYQQRHHADQQIGWLNCEAFMQRDFGSPMPSFYEALASNPSAMAGHFGWNATLFPYALQMALFNRSSGSDFHDPDYVKIPTGSVLAFVGSVLVLALVVVGLRLLWVRREDWWREWLSLRAWGWAVLLCAAFLGTWVAITTHPRPGYLFSLNFVLYAVIGMCAMAVVRRWPGLGRARVAIPIAALALFLLVPAHYHRGYSNPIYGTGKVTATIVSHLDPYREYLRGHDTRLLSARSFEACNYVIPEDDCDGAPIGFYGPLGTDENAWLDDHGVDLIYADPSLLANPQVRQTLASLQRDGWQRIGPPDPASADWLLLGRRSLVRAVQARS
ncbi:MAG TPA: hypothetical protein VI035_02730 [Solirubrobacterales bacterium]